jgi:hypothetical protein
VNVRLPFVMSMSLLVPLCAATAMITSIVVGERLGARPFAGLQAQNSAEAAALAHAGDVLRFLEMGEDPHAVYPVRPEVISSAILRATTVEAAMWSRQVEMIKLLDREGIIRDHERASLVCLAVDLQVDDVVEYLAPTGVHACEPGQALAGVVARTRTAGASR